MPERILENVGEIKLIVLGLLAWASRLAFKSGLTVGIVARQLIISVLIGVIASEFVFSSTFADWQTIAIYCALVFLADDILMMALAFGDYAKDNQQTLFKRITGWFAGKG